MKATLIGFPNAGERWNWTGHAADVLAEMNQKTGDADARARARAGKLALSAFGWTGGADVVAPHRMDWGVLPDGLEDIGVLAARQGDADITGDGRKGKAKRARAVGVGKDAEVQRADELAQWLAGGALAARADDLAECDGATAAAQLAAVEAELSALVVSRSAIMAGIASDSEQGRRILALAGGAGFGNGQRQVVLTGGGMAARAARYVFKARGRMPSDTSLQDAGAAAVASMWFEWQCYSALCGDAWNTTAARHCAAYGWRAAFHSYTRDAAEGMTGRKAGQSTATGGNALELDAAQLDIERKSLEAWARDRQGRVFDAGDDGGAARAKRARRGVLVWLASVLDVRAKGRIGAAERARFSVLARLVHGRDIATAARVAGFANGRQALDSFRTGKVWLRLRLAVKSHKGQSERKLMAVRARAMRAAMSAIGEQRAARAGAGRSQGGAAVARAVILASGAAAVSFPAGIGQTAAAVAGLARLTRPAGKRRVAAQGLAGRGAVHPLARAWATATARRGQAVALAQAARDALRAVQAARVAAFDSATVGMRGGWRRGC